MMRLASGMITRTGTAMDGTRPGPWLRLPLRPARFAQLIGPGLRLLEVDRALVQRAAGDHTNDPFRLERAERFHVLQAGEPTACDHRRPQLAREADRRVHVHTGQHAVAPDAGVNDR